MGGDEYLVSVFPHTHLSTTCLHTSLCTLPHSHTHTHTRRLSHWVFPCLTHTPGSLTHALIDTHTHTHPLHRIWVFRLNSFKQSLTYIFSQTYVVFSLPLYLCFRFLLPSVHTHIHTHAWLSYCPALPYLHVTVSPPPTHNSGCYYRCQFKSTFCSLLPFLPLPFPVGFISLSFYPCSHLFPVHPDLCWLLFLFRSLFQYPAVQLTSPYLFLLCPNACIVSHYCRPGHIFTLLDVLPSLLHTCTHTELSRNTDFVLDCFPHSKQLNTSLLPQLQISLPLSLSDFHLYTSFSAPLVHVLVTLAIYPPLSASLYLHFILPSFHQYLLVPN